MPRVIKSSNVIISEDAQLIDVPTKDFFNPHIGHKAHNVKEEEGFVPADYGGKTNPDDSPRDDTDDFVDPELVIKSAEEEAEKIIKAANNEADLIIQKAKLTAEEEKAAAIVEGKSVGYEQGSAHAAQEYEGLLAQASQTLEDAREEREGILASLEGEIVTLIADIVEKLVGDSLLLNKNVILHIIRTGVENVAGATELSIRVSKEDFETAAELKDDIMQMVDSDTVVSIVKDTALSMGGCVIDTPIGSIDSSLDKQWQTLKNDLFLLLRE